MLAVGVDFAKKRFHRACLIAGCCNSAGNNFVPFEIL